MIDLVRVPVLVLLLSAMISSPALAQAKPPAEAQTQPPAPTKFIPAVKGVVTIEVIRPNPRRVGNDMVTTLKIKNTTKGSIALLGIEEFWYDEKGKVISGATEKVRRFISPGEIVEVTTKSPIKPGMYSNAFTFTHANGPVKAKQVKKFVEK